MVRRGALFLVLAAACARPPTTATTTGRRLNPSISGWLPQNRERLDRLLASRGKDAPSYDPAHPPVATFDWDNTMMRNDIGDATMAWMLLHDAILQPPKRDWSVTSEDLTPEARSALNAACDGAAEPGRPLATTRVAGCADEIHAIYDAGKTHAGARAWAHETTLTTKQPYAWAARLLAGHTAEEVRGFALAAYRADSSAPIGFTRTIGTHTGVSGWVRIYEPMRDLVGALGANGFDVWIVSASPQHLAEVVGNEVGIRADHVVGVRNVQGADGRLGYDLEDCGGAPRNTVMTFDQGKRCWINKAIFHLPASGQLQRAPLAQRPTFSAGDSDTDVAFVQDATTLKLVIDRNRPALMCNALSNHDDKWLIQPMFIEPSPARSEPYACSTFVDEAGRPIADQRPRP